MGKNIAVLIWSLYSGGAERIAGLLSVFLERDNNVYVMVLDDSNQVYAHGGSLICIRKKSEDWGITYEETVYKLKKELGIDVSISFLEGMNALNICSRADDVVIISERSTQSKIVPKNPLNDMTIERYYHYADAIVACSYGVKYDLEQSYSLNDIDIDVIYNFIDKEFIKESAKEILEQDIADFIADSVFYINVGRLDKQKNQAHLILEFCKFLKMYPTRKLLILGNGKERENLERIIYDNNLQGNVRIYPYTSNPFKYIKKANAVIVSSLYEGLPNVILESMVLGKLVISTDSYSGPRELLLDIDDYNFILKPFNIGLKGIVLGDWKENISDVNIADALFWVEKNDKKIEELINNELEFIEGYSIEKIEDQWIDIINNTKPTRKAFTNSSYEILSNASKKYIYGAGKVGTGLFNMLRKQHRIDGFIVTKKDQEYNFEIEVYEIDDIEINDSVVIIIGVGSGNANEVMEKLNERNVKNIVYFPFL